jgi:hypothetical protein
VTREKRVVDAKAKVLYVVFDARVVTYQCAIRMRMSALPNTALII